MPRESVSPLRRSLRLAGLLSRFGAGSSLALRRRLFAAGIAGLAACLPASALAASLQAAAAHTYRTPTGDQFFAVAVRASADAVGHHPAARHVLLVDTSASQAGVHRQQTLTMAKAFLAALPSEAEVALFSVDTEVRALSDGMVPPHGPAANTAIERLQNRVPLGATDLKAGLNAALAAFGDRPAGSVIYVGDGMSAANLLAGGELKPILENYRAHQVPIHGYAVGPNTDWRLMGVLAYHTGGIAEIDGARPDEPVADIAQRYVAASTGTLIYPEAIQAGDAKLLVGESLPPLRTDRDTLLVGRGEVPTEISIRAGDQTLTETTQPRIVESQPVVRQLALAAERSGGLDMPIAGSSLLAFAAAGIESQTEQASQVGTGLIQAGRIDDAKRLYVSLENADPAGDKTRALAIQLAQAGDNPILPPADENPLTDPNAPPAAAPSTAIPPAPSANPTPTLQDDLLGASIERQRVLTQQLTIQTNAVIAESSQIRQTDPGDALTLLKRFEATVRAANDIDPEIRRQLLRRLNNEISGTAALQDQLELDLILRQERLAQLEAEQRMAERMIVEEERLEQLIERVRALMIAGYHGDDAAFEEALVVARDAVNLRPGNGPATAAIFTAKAADQLNKAFRLRELRDDRFLETLYQVELSHVPFPDEPPVVYPPPEVWQALTERRRKFASVSLETTSPAEERIRAALDQETVLEFPSTPLRDAIQFLANYHDINVIFDEAALSAEGINPDDPIDIVLSGISLRSALNVMLEPLNLTYVIEDEVMKITTVTIAEESLSVRVYPVGDLVIPIASPLAGGLGQGLGGAGGFAGGGAGGQGGGGQFGQGGAGGGGGLGGGGLFSIPVQQFPGQAQRAGHAVRNNGRDVPQRPAAQPVDDAELRGLLDDIVGNPEETPADDDLAKKKEVTTRPVVVADAAIAIQEGATAPRPGDSSPVAGLAFWSVPPEENIPPEEAEQTDSPAELWNRYFAEKRPSPEDVRRLVLKLNEAKKHDHVIAVINAALLNGQGQPWMYEVLALSLEITGAPQAEVERVLLSGVDFSATDVNGILLSAAYLTRFGADAPALRLFRQASSLAPERPEPYLLGLDLASKLKDDEALGWAVTGVFTTAWGKDHARQHRRAEDAVRDRIASLNKAGETEAAQQLARRLIDAKQADLVVKVVWSGPGDVDLSVQEPSGTVCSIENTRTAGGGVLVHDGFGPRAENAYEEYVCAAGFPGVYKLSLRYRWGDIVGKRVKVIVTRHRGTPHETTRELSLPLEEDEATISVTLPQGRREDWLTVPNEPATSQSAPRGTILQQLGPLDANALAAARRFQSTLRQVGPGGGLPGGGLPGGGGVGLGGGAAGGVGGVGYRPVTSVVSEGVTLSSQAVVSGDRRYVRLTLAPTFSNITDVFTFSFATGGP